MQSKTKSTLIFLLSLILAMGVYVWFFTLNKGLLSIESTTPNYRLWIDGEPFFCEESLCQYPLKPGQHEIIAQKDDHLPFSQLAQVKRSGISTVKIHFQAVYRLEKSTVIPLSKINKTKAEELSRAPKNIKPHSFTWNTRKDKMLFLDEEDGRVKIWSKEEGMKEVTSLKNIAGELHFFWSPNEEMAVIQEENSLYLIDIETGGRQKTLNNFTPLHSQWSPGNQFFFNNNENTLHIINWDEKMIEAAQELVSLKNSAWLNKRTLLYFTADEEKNMSIIETYDVKDKIKTNLITQFNLKLKYMSLDRTNQIAYFQDNEGQWYELELGEKL